MALHAQLKRRAAELGLSDAEIARRTGLDPRRYGHYTTGRSEPDTATLLRIARVLRTTPNRLLLGEEERPRAEALDRLLAAAQTLGDHDLEGLVVMAEALAEHRQTAKQQRRRTRKSVPKSGDAD